MYLSSFTAEVWINPYLFDSQPTIIIFIHALEYLQGGNNIINCLESEDTSQD